MRFTQFALAVTVSSALALTACAQQQSQGNQHAAANGPAQVTTYAQSHPHPEYNMTYAADKDCKSVDGVLIRKGVCVWFKGAPTGKTQEARLEDGSIHTLTVSEFYQVDTTPTAVGG